MVDNFIDGSERFTFLRLPKELFKSNLSVGAKLVYARLLDLHCLAQKNSQTSKDGRVYVTYTIEQVCCELSVGKEKATSIFCELKDQNLIDRVKRGQGRAAYIYVKRCVGMNCEFGAPEPQTADNSPSSSLLSSGQGCGKAAGYNTQNDTYSHNTHPHHTGYEEEEVKEQIGYLALVEIYSELELAPILDALLWAQQLTDSVKINGAEYTPGQVRARYSQVGMSHVQYVLDRVRDVSHIRSISGLVRALLYDAPVAMDSYYDLQLRDLV